MGSIGASRNNGSSVSNSSVEQIVQDRVAQLGTMSKQEKISYLEALVSAQSYRKEHNEDTTVVDAVVKAVQDNLNGSNRQISAKEQAYMNWKAIKISKNMPKEEQDRRRRLKAQYRREYESL